MTSERDKQIVRLFRSGATTPAIGEQFSITRERVCQILHKAGVSRTDGGRAKTATENRQARAEAREKRCLSLWGLTSAEYRTHADRYGTCTDQTTPMGRFLIQRKRAGERGIEWRLTFKEWWAIWRRSKRYGRRGRGDGFVMARKRRAGAYEAGNVEIVCQSKASWAIDEPRHLSALPGARAAFRASRGQCHREGVEWSLSFETWCGIWEESGRWDERGRHTGCYQMVRKNPALGVTAGNVRIERRVAS